MDTTPEPRPASLMAQFVALAGVVLVLGMLGTGFWVSSQIEEIVTDNAGAVTALYVDAVISPVTQDMAEAGGLGDAARARLDGLLQRGALRSQISAFKLWDVTGRVIYSDRPQLVGQFAPGNPRLAVALRGQVHAALRDVPALTADGRLMEVYTPVRSAGTGEIIAVAEFYSTTGGLRADLLRSRLQSWLVVGLVTLSMFVALSTLFARGSRTILRQRRALDEKIAELSATLDRNEALTRRVDRANLRIAEINERTLRRLSADLHDGPAQLLAFAALRLDGAPGQQQVSEAVNEALQELRCICRGLVLPELEGWSVPTIARRLIATQKERMGREVGLQIGPDLPDMALGAKNCIYRFVQETLNNGARHAAGAAQTVTIRREGEGIAIEVRDEGPGFDPDADGDGLGIVGLRERVAGLKGRFALQSRPGAGTSVRMWLPAREAEPG